METKIERTEAEWDEIQRNHRYKQCMENVANRKKHYESYLKKLAMLRSGLTPIQVQQKLA